MTAKIDKVLLDLEGGVFEQKINKALGDVAAAVMDHEKVGQVQITLDLRKIQNSDQVTVRHTLKYKKPTARGTVTEDNASDCPMYVTVGGNLSIFPENQKDLFRSED